MIKQFVPQEFCLKCKGCCRFRDANSVWAPCLLDEEIQELLDKKIPSACINADKRICLIANPQTQPLHAGAGYICPFLNVGDNKCKIYDFRPLECQLYPFLLNLRGKKAVLTLDLNCPYVSQNVKSKELKDYSEYLADFLNSGEQLEILRDNPHILQAYEEVLEVVELNWPDVPK